jgi:hypothetical protein
MRREGVFNPRAVSIGDRAVNVRVRPRPVCALTSRVGRTVAAGSRRPARDLYDSAVNLGSPLGRPVRPFATRMDRLVARS